MHVYVTSLFDITSTAFWGPYVLCFILNFEIIFNPISLLLEADKEVY